MTLRKAILSSPFAWAAFCASVCASSPLFLFQHPQTGNYGYLNRSGRIKIPPVFASAAEFSEGRAVVFQMDGAHGHNMLIDTSGKPVMRFSAMEKDIFQAANGLVPYAEETGIGAYDLNGKNVFHLGRKDIGISKTFRYGLLLVEGEGGLGLVNGSGVLVAEPRYNLVHRLPGGIGLLAAGGRKVGNQYVGGSWTYIDSAGTVIYRWECGEVGLGSGVQIPSFFQSRVDWFEENIGSLEMEENRYSTRIFLPPYRYRYYDPEIGRFGFIDQAGRIAIKARYAWALEFFSGYGFAKNEGDRDDIVCIDKNGKEAPTPPFYSTGFISEGLFVCCDKYLVTRIVDTRGKVFFESVSMMYDHWNSQSFSEGLVVGRDFPSGRFFYCDRYGRKPFPSTYTHAWPFKNGLALVNEGGIYVCDLPSGVQFFRDNISGGVWSYIDKRGKAIFSWADWHENGLRE